MKRIVLESPYAGELAENIAYAKACVRDCLMKGESVFASHLLYTQDGIFRDDIPAERTIGIAAGHAWIAIADALVVYTDRGISPSMKTGIYVATTQGKPIEYRTLPTWLQPGAPS